MNLTEEQAKYGTIDHLDVSNGEVSPQGSNRMRSTILSVTGITLVIVAAWAVFYQGVLSDLYKKEEKTISDRDVNTTYQQGLWTEETQEERRQRCKNIDWIRACERVEAAEARRRRHRRLEEFDDEYNDEDDETASDFEYENDGNDTDFAWEEQYSTLEKELLEDSNDDSVVYDENCLRIYRLDLGGGVTFPYLASNILRAGGNQTMTLFIQHGAQRNADAYFCSFRKLMLKQKYRKFNEIMVIAPNFNYKRDDGVIKSDAFWNSSKPWGDWRVGAESDPDCCFKKGRHSHSISSFGVLDHMLGLLTDRWLFPKMEKITYLGHSAGGQMVQRYAVASELAAYFDIDPTIDLQFVIANPSSYTYLTSNRWTYNCGNCTCTRKECDCDGPCTKIGSMTGPHDGGTSGWPCHNRYYDRWPYGLGSFANEDYSIPYIRPSGVWRSQRLYQDRHVVYMVGQNDTCNDILPVCDQSCWKRDVYDLESEWPCYRNHMDARCPAMLQGPNRKERGLHYMKHLETYYGKKTHMLHVVPDTGHDAAKMFESEIGMKEIFQISRKRGFEYDEDDIRRV